MGWFKKKSDPISERARALNDQIAQLEAQIRDLSSEPTEETPERPSVGDQDLAVEPSRAHDSSSRAPLADSAPLREFVAPLSPPTPPPPKWSQAKLRSTAFPLGAHIPAAASPHPSGPGPIFEEVGPNPFRGDAMEPPPPQKLDVRRSDWAAGWRRFKNHFRSPATSNPKLVNYLAAGSIQGLRPLRYEKRVARNRFILLLVVLIVVLWGIIALFLRR